MPQESKTESTQGETTAARPSANPRSGTTLAQGPHDHPGSKATNLNAASVEEIGAVDFVGGSLAQTIVAARERLGSFSSWDELRLEAGLKANKIAELQRSFRLMPRA